MKKYKYIGDEDKVYVDVTGKKILLSYGTRFTCKQKPDWDTIEELKTKTTKGDE